MILVTVVVERSDYLSMAIPRAQIASRLASEDNLRTPILRSRSAARLLQCYATT